MTPTPTALKILNDRNLPRRDRDAVIRLASSLAEERGRTVVNSGDVYLALQRVLGAKLEGKAVQ